MAVASRVLAAGAILLGLTVGAHASVMYDNLAGTSTTDPYSVISGYTPNSMATSFTANGLDLTDVSLMLSGGTNTSSMLVVSLFADSGSNTPGTMLTQIRSVYDSLISSSTPAVYDFKLTTPYSLTSGDRYWIEVSDVGGTSSWSYVGNATGTGTMGEYSYEGGAQYANDSSGFYLQACIASDSGSGTGCSGPAPTATFTTDSPAPEPASLAILGAAVIGLGAIKRYRKAA